MSELQKQEEEIEQMRARLHDLVITKAGNMIDHEVGQLSAELDQLIVKYQKVKVSSEIPKGSMK